MDCRARYVLGLRIRIQFTKSGYSTLGTGSTLQYNISSLFRFFQFSGNSNYFSFAVFVVFQHFARIKVSITLDAGLQIKIIFKTLSIYVGGSHVSKILILWTVPFEADNRSLKTPFSIFSFFSFRLVIWCRANKSSLCVYISICINLGQKKGKKRGRKKCWQ